MGGAGGGWRRGGRGRETVRRLAREHVRRASEPCVCSRSGPDTYVLRLERGCCSQLPSAPSSCHPSSQQGQSRAKAAFPTSTPPNHAPVDNHDVLLNDALVSNHDRARHGEQGRARVDNASCAAAESRVSSERALDQIQWARADWAGGPRGKNLPEPSVTLPRRSASCDTMQRDPILNEFVLRWEMSEVDGPRWGSRSRRWCQSPCSGSALDGQSVQTYISAISTIGSLTRSFLGSVRVVLLASQARPAVPTATQSGPPAHPTRAGNRSVVGS